VGKGRLKERCELEQRTDFFLFKKSPETECVLDSRIYGICPQYKVFSHIMSHCTDLKVTNQCSVTFILCFPLVEG
jgi:hypothetical protein